jgi:nucleotidyltransferase substrate binding protein (TIGR01987 family)
MHNCLGYDYFVYLGNALNRLEDLLIIPENKAQEYLKDAMIYRFKFSIELFWKVLKKILLSQGIDAGMPREILNKYFQYSLLDAEKPWLAMINDRNQTSHIYKEEIADKIFLNIKQYFPVMKRTYESLNIKFFQDEK